MNRAGGKGVDKVGWDRHHILISVLRCTIHHVSIALNQIVSEYVPLNRK